MILLYYHGHALIRFKRNSAESFLVLQMRIIALLCLRPRYHVCMVLYVYMCVLACMCVCACSMFTARLGRSFLEFFVSTFLQSLLVSLLIKLC